MGGVCHSLIRPARFTSAGPSDLGPGGLARPPRSWAGLFAARPAALVNGTREELSRSLTLLSELRFGMAEKPGLIVFLVVLAALPYLPQKEKPSARIVDARKDSGPARIRFLDI